MLIVDSPLAIHDLVRQQSVTARFQPLVSIKKRSMIGVESLARGINPQTGDIIPPDIMFAQAAKEGAILELDRLCRQMACSYFTPLSQQDANLLLFLNFDTAILDEGVVGSDYLLQQVQQAGINPNTVAIEIIESKVRDLGALRRFVETYRDYGFLIALDDIGTGYSNLDRIPLLKPDILKIDRSLIRNIHDEYYKQVVFKSMVNLARNIGALVVAEGVETEQEAVTTLEFGADFLQGFYFATPQEARVEILRDGCDNIESVAARYRNSMIDHVRSLKARHRYYDTIITDFVHELEAATEEGFDQILKQKICEYEALECVYVLDHRGTQVSETVSCIEHSYERRKAYFRPAKRGTDHSLKEYFYLLVNTSIDKFTTDPYISLASGSPCVTISVLFADVKGEERILCIDVNPE